MTVNFCPYFIGIFKVTLFRGRGLRLVRVMPTVLTLFEVTRNRAPSGTNMMPMMKKAGRTVPAVRMGCHAGSLCCLKAVSVE